MESEAISWLTPTGEQSQCATIERSIRQKIDFLAVRSTTWLPLRKDVQLLVHLWKTRGRSSRQSSRSAVNRPNLSSRLGDDRAPKH
jgi:hypothetical protein